MSTRVARSMKTIAIGSIFVLFAIVTGIVATAPTAFADHMTASVSIAAGSSVPGCEANNECFVPYQVSIDPGGEVTWSNDDTAAHTVTSGTAADGPDGNWDSSLFMAGNTFSVKFDDYEPGTYPYFCMVHPWMTGEVIVEEAGVHEEDGQEEEHVAGTTEIMGMISDGSIMVKLSTGTPTTNEGLSIDVEFTDANGKAIEHANYDITATQNGESVLEDIGAHEHMGKGSHMTAPLSSDDPVDVTVTFQGIGVDTITGPQGEVVQFTVVPEFGTIAVMILGVAIISIIAVTAKSRVIPKL